MSGQDNRERALAGHPPPKDTHGQPGPRPPAPDSLRVEAQDSRSVRFSHFHSGSSAAHAEAVALDGHRVDTESRQHTRMR